jgi:hypothetical protein
VDAGSAGIAAIDAATRSDGGEAALGTVGNSAGVPLALPHAARRGMTAQLITRRTPSTLATTRIVHNTGRLERALDSTGG